MSPSFITRTFPPLLLAVAAFGGASAPGKDEGADSQSLLPKLLMEFAGAENEPTWTAVNDGVMGGLSKGSAKMEDGMLHFSGTLSLENNGGFSSVRTQGRDYDLSAVKTMVLRVNGDGRTYQLRISTDARFRGSRISYSGEIPTKAGEWIEVKVPLASLKPSFRGSRLDGPPLDLSKIEEIGLLLGDKRAGDFSLKLDWIKAE